MSALQSRPVPSVAPATPAASDAPAAVAPPPGHPRFPLVDAMRAFAALSVLFFHVGELSGTTWGGYLSHGDAGVALFFVISGFLLYRPFVSVRLNGARRSTVRAYLRRRVLRIVPAYWLALTVLAIWPTLPGVFSGHFWAYYGFAQVYNDNWVLGGIGAAWTLCCEVVFYLSLPLYAAGVAALLGRLDRRRQVTGELLILAALALASLTLRYLETRHNPFAWMLNAFPTQFDWFAGGMILAVISAAWQDRPLPRPLAVIARYPIIPLGAAAIIYTLVVKFEHGPTILNFEGHILEFYSPNKIVYRHVMYLATAVCLLTPAVLGSGGRIRGALAMRWLGWIGLISYGIYLWHQPLLGWLCQPRPGEGCHLHGVAIMRSAPFLTMAIVVFCVTIACAAASYYFVERPILRYKR